MNLKTFFIFAERRMETLAKTKTFYKLFFTLYLILVRRELLQSKYKNYTFLLTVILY